ncbi:MAG: hypothetical protein OXH15_11820 [Gammaproteobacteria bacterium]|nr:hypothetical protein [Gammaproteobacteria bacterium]
MRPTTRRLLPLSAAAFTIAAAANPAVDGTKLTEQTRTYRMAVELPEETVDMTTSTSWTRTTRDRHDVWLVHVVNDSSLGRMVEDIYLRRDDLLPVHRTVEQAGVRLAMDYTDSAVQGQASFPDGQHVPIDVPLSAPAIGHMESVLAVLPLTPGSTVELTTFEPTMQMERRWRVVVTQTESTATPAGTFETYRLEINDPESTGTPGLYWVTRSPPHHTVQSRTTLPDTFGGGEVNVVLDSVETPTP